MDKFIRDTIEKLRQTSLEDLDTRLFKEMESFLGRPLEKIEKAHARYLLDLDTESRNTMADKEFNPEDHV